MIRITTPIGREIPAESDRKRPYKATQETRYKILAETRPKRIILSRECGNRFQCTSERIVVAASTTVPNVQSTTDSADFPE